MADEGTKATTSNKPEQASGLMKARLLARFWMQPIIEEKTGKVVNHQRVMQGQVVEIPREMFAALNEFRPSFEEVAE